MAIAGDRRAAKDWENYRKKSFRMKVKADKVMEAINKGALTRIMKKAYPDLEPTRSVHGTKRGEYQKRLLALKERLRSGRNWERIQADFAPAILLLIPRGEEYKIRDSE
jgi:hypothetical protein